MCGRYEFTVSAEVLAERFKAKLDGELRSSVNVAPTTQIPIVRPGEISMARWGIVPPWEKTFATKYPTFNARAEEIWEKASFKKLVPNQRCLVPVPAFYEWKVVNGEKIPMRIAPKNTEWGVAGLWSDWQGKTSATMLTTGATDAMQGLHTRMPLFLPRELEAEWLQADLSRKEIDELLALQPSVIFDITPADPRLNNVRWQGA